MALRGLRPEGRYRDDHGERRGDRPEGPRRADRGGLFRHHRCERADDQARSGLPSGKVKAINLTNSHNCCRSCGTAIQKAVKSVPGVWGETVQPKKADFEVTGDFDAAALVKALNDAASRSR